MLYTFKTLTAEEQEEMLVNTLKAQELDLYMHTMNKERFQDMITALPDGNDFKTKLQSEIVVIDSRLVEVNTTIASLEKQIPVELDIAVVMTRIKNKEDLAKGIAIV